MTIFPAPWLFGEDVKLQWADSGYERRCKNQKNHSRSRSGPNPLPHDYTCCMLLNFWIIHWLDEAGVSLVNSHTPLTAVTGSDWSTVVHRSLSAAAWLLNRGKHLQFINQKFYLKFIIRNKYETGQKKTWQKFCGVNWPWVFQKFCIFQMFGWYDCGISGVKWHLCLETLRQHSSWFYCGDEWSQVSLGACR